MQFEISDEHGNLIIRFSGEVDYHAHPHSRDIILGCLNQGRNTYINLSAVTYIDSSGVASFVEGYQLAKEQNLEFGLMDLSDAVLRVLHMAHLDKAFPVNMIS